MTINIPAPEGLWIITTESDGTLLAAPVIAFTGEDLYELRTVMLMRGGFAHGARADASAVFVYIGDGWLAQSPFPGFRIHTPDTLPEEYRHLLTDTAPKKTPVTAAPSTVQVAPVTVPVLSDPDVQEAARIEKEERDAHSAKRSRHELEEAIVDAVNNTSLVTAKVLPVLVGSDFAPDDVQAAADDLVRRNRIAAVAHGSSARYYPRPRRHSYAAASTTGVLAEKDTP